jgi:hypothetical protein
LGEHFSEVCNTQSRVYLGEMLCNFDERGKDREGDLSQVKGSAAIDFFRPFV